MTAAQPVKTWLLGSNLKGYERQPIPPASTPALKQGKVLRSDGEAAREAFVLALVRGYAVGGASRHVCGLAKVNL